MRRLPVLVALALAPAVIASSAVASLGSADPSFGVGGTASAPLPAAAGEAKAGIVDLAAAPGGGTYAVLAGLGRPAFFGLARLDEAGSPDPSFGTAGFTAPFVDPTATRVEPGPSPSGPEAEAVALQPDSSVVVAGAIALRAYVAESGHTFESFRPLLVRYLPDGSLDPTFGEAGSITPEASNDVVHDVTVTAAGRIVAAIGSDLKHGSGSGQGVYAFEPDGSSDLGFGRKGRALLGRRRSPLDPRAIAPLPDDGFLVAGFRNSNPVLAELRSDGRLDRRFGGDGFVRIATPYPRCCPRIALTITPDGRPVVALYGGVRRERASVARFRQGGARDRTFGGDGVITLPAAFEQQYGIAVDASGATYVAGAGRNHTGPRSFAYTVARIAASGWLDQPFGRNGVETLEPGSASIAGAALTLPGGGVLIGGSYEGGTQTTQQTSLLLNRYLAG